MLQKHSTLHALIRKYLGIWGLAAAAVAGLLIGGNAAWAADEQFVARANITLSGGQKVTAFDISFDDPVIGLYLLADRTNAEVQAVDTYTNTLLRSEEHTSELQSR